MVKRDLLIRRRLVGRENPARHVRPRCGPTDVRQLFVPERLHDLVEICRSLHRESTKEHGAARLEQRLDVCLLGLDRVGEFDDGTERRCRVGAEDGWEGNAIEGPLLG